MARAFRLGDPQRRRLAARRVCPRASRRLEVQDHHVGPCPRACRRRAVRCRRNSNERMPNRSRFVGRHVDFLRLVLHVASCEPLALENHAYNFMIAIAVRRSCSCEGARSSTRAFAHHRAFRPLCVVASPASISCAVLLRVGHRSCDGTGRRHPGRNHHQGQCHGRGRRRGVLPGARRGQGGL